MAGFPAGMQVPGAAAGATTYNPYLQAVLAKLMGGQSSAPGSTAVAPRPTAAATSPAPAAATPPPPPQPPVWTPGAPIPTTGGTIWPNAPTIAPQTPLTSTTGPSNPPPPNVPGPFGNILAQMFNTPGMQNQFARSPNAMMSAASPQALNALSMFFPAAARG